MRNAPIYNIVGDLKGKLTRNDVIIITTKNKNLYDSLITYLWFSYCNYHLLYSVEIKEKKKNNDQY